MVQRARSLRVRAVVGLWGNHTDPVALRILARIGKLRLVEGDRRFHPKVYIFRGYEKTVAWVGERELYYRRICNERGGYVSNLCDEVG